MSDFIQRSYTNEIRGEQIVDGSVSQKDIQRLKYTYETFGLPPLCGGVTNTGLPTGTAGDLNIIHTGDNVFQYHINGTQTILYPTWAAATGLSLAFDATADDGFELSQGITSASRSAMIAGVDNFYFQAKVSLQDVSGTDDCAIGWRKAEAKQANLDDYDELVCMNVISKDVKIESILNGAATATVDTTNDVADGEYIIVRIEHDSTVGLSSAITLANDLKAKYNAHCADATEHTTAADLDNQIIVDDATNLVDLLVLTNSLTTKYVLHDNDTELGAAWLYHGAQEGANNSLTAVTTVTTLPGAIKRLNDFKTKFNAHDADDTTHGTKALHASATVAASATTFKKGINTATLTAPTVTTQFTFDDGEVVVPFFFFLQDTDICIPSITHWEVGTL